MDGRAQISQILKIFLLQIVARADCKSPATLCNECLSRLPVDCVNVSLFEYIYCVRRWRAPSKLQYMSNLGRRTDDPRWSVPLSLCLIVCSLYSISDIISIARSGPATISISTSIITISSHRPWTAIFSIFSENLTSETRWFMWQGFAIWSEMCKACHWDSICSDVYKGDPTLCCATQQIFSCQLFLMLSKFSLEIENKKWERDDLHEDKNGNEREESNVTEIPAKEWTLCLTICNLQIQQLNWRNTY